MASTGCQFRLYALAIEVDVINGTLLYCTTKKRALLKSSVAAFSHNYGQEAYKDDAEAPF